MKERNLVLGTIILLVLVGLGFALRPQGERIPGQDNFLTEEENPKNNNLSLPADVLSDQEQKNQEMNSDQKKISWSEPPRLTIDQSLDYRVVLTTSAGKITIDLSEKETPITVNNFVFLANQGFYDGVIFHRVIEGFMIQSGCPKGDGTGGPGYQFADEPFEGQYTRGTVAMANAGPNTNGSQFFVIHQDTSLPSNYVVFGRVIEGMETVDKIASSPVQANLAGETSSPINPVVITDIEITTR
ncbi:MAG: peptidylprolyl isomerase [Candidatus Shapirobacteria bacterium]|nr:peptidylprolyl isomerase [Candidatus Shapirobacteria bacterium]MDD5073830.1 peptidylprolyl isomerase [Candidatus Shapirobacteria bacterium]MDD5481824.1 peptidylprolyl isomerase [Candidatus Shapirobacteria bacterium]